MSEDWGGGEDWNGSGSPRASFSGYDFSTNTTNSNYSTATSNFSIAGSYHFVADDNSTLNGSVHSDHAESGLKHAYSRLDDRSRLADILASDDLDRASDHTSPVRLNHGFSLGELCPTLTKTSSLGQQHEDCKEENDEEEEDEGIGEAYGHLATEGLIAPTPVTGRRHVISKIGSIGHVAQNLALGHRVGILADDSMLIPQTVKPEPAHVVIEADSPLQTDIRWTPPSNSHNFGRLSYETELNKDEQANWQSVTTTMQPVIRVYHTDDVMLIGRHRITRQKYDRLVMLRIRAQGEISNGHLVVASEWSDDILIYFTGYEAEREITQMTCL